MKQLTALILSAALILPVVPVTAIADSDIDTSVTVYEEKFESETIAQEIKGKQYGWSYDGDGDAAQKIDLRVESCEGGDGDGKNLFFSSGDSWYKTMWQTLDFEENGVYQRISRGAEQDEAEASVNKYLTNDMSILFSVKFEQQGMDALPNKHEQYIRFKDSDYNAIAELRTISYYPTDSDKDNKQNPVHELYLKALNSDKNGYQLYKIGEIDATSKNTEWHDFKIDFDFQNSRYRVSMDGAVFDGTTHGEWIPAGKDSGNSAELNSFTKIQSMELGHFWAGWYSSLYIDNLAITNSDSTAELPKETPKPSEDPDTTEKPAETKEPVATEEPAPTVEPTPDPNIKYIEKFEDASIVTNIRNKANGWDYGLENKPDLSERNMNLWLGDNGGGDKNSLRFASDSIWYRDMWLILNMKQHFTAQEVLNGKDVSEAEAEVANFLNSDIKISFDARFGASGRSDNANDVHEEYIKLKGSDTSAIAELRVYINPQGSNKPDTLNLKLPNDELYELCEINTAQGREEWHKFAFYLDHQRNAYMLEMDGEILKNSNYGKWIPSISDGNTQIPLAIPESLELGHHWSGWWQDICIDNLALSTYEAVEDEYEISSIKILNEHGGTTLTGGSVYSAEVTVTGGETATQNLTWEYSNDNQSTWTPLTQESVPEDATHIKVTVECISAKGETVSGEQVAEISAAGNVDYVEIVSENFENSEKEREIVEQKNGWSIKGQSNQVKVGTGFGGTRNSLRFASTASNVTNNLRLDLTKRGAAFDKNDKVYLKLDFSFGLGSDEDTVNSASLAYVRIKDMNNRAFATVSLLGDTMYMTYYDEDAKKNKQSVIAQGQSIVLDTWRTMELYLDTERNKFCMLVDGQAVGPDGDKWFTPSDSIVPGIGKPNSVTGISAIEIGQENSAWWENTCIDNISLQKYYLPSASTLTVDGIELTNAYNAEKSIVTGGSVKMSPVTSEGTVMAGTIYTMEYYNGKEWKEADGEIIPSDAEKIRVKGSFTDVYGQTAEAISEEISVTKNQAPSITALKVTGSSETGSVLTPEYTFTDADGDGDESEFIWSRSNNSNGVFTEIARGVKEYTVTEKDAGNIIRFTLIPRDSFGVCASKIEYDIVPGENSLFSAVWKKVYIPAQPASDTISLPSKDEEYGVSFTWSSSNSSVISSSGDITRPSYGYITVTLTGVAKDENGNTDRRVFAVTITGKNGSSSGGAGGGGGGSSGNKTSSGNVAVIPRASAAPLVQWTEDSQNDFNKPTNRIFSDVDDSAWYAKDVYALKAKGIVSGDEKGNFNPENNITRAEFVKMLVELMGIKDSSAVCEFSDAAENDWYYTYVASAVKFGIARGMDNGTFGAAANITRQDIAVMAASAIRLTKTLDESGSTEEFADSQNIASYAEGSVKAMRNAGIMRGSDGLFRPTDNATRAESARVIHMLGEYVEKTE